MGWMTIKILTYIYIYTHTPIQHKSNYVKEVREWTIKLQQIIFGNNTCEQSICTKDTHCYNSILKLKLWTISKVGWKQYLAKWEPNSC